MKTLRVDVPGGSVVTYSFGEGEQTVVVISGGPGASCDYMRESHKQYADQGFRVVAWDQLGTGQSDRPELPPPLPAPRAHRRCGRALDGGAGSSREDDQRQPLQKSMLVMSPWADCWDWTGFRSQGHRLSNPTGP